MTVRTRFAPSPTGYMHIGGMRTALFNWLWARRNGGQFILRIDDTDQARNLDTALAPILSAFRWLGLNWDEGPEVGGPCGPYFQSQRNEFYRTAAEKLLAEGKAYKCFETTEQIQADRTAAEREQRQYVNIRRSLELTAAQIADLEAQGREPVIRFLVPRDQKVVFDDAVRGVVEFDAGLISDPVIVRANGMPLYNFATVVDDAAFRISDVIRAEEHLSNTPIQFLLHEALGSTIPRFAHIPYVAAPGSKEKLSKRKLEAYRKNPQFKRMFERAEAVFPRIGLDREGGLDPVMVEYYEKIGYLPDAVVNALSRIGWSLDDKTEIMSRETIVSNFSLDRVVKKPAGLDPDKLDSFQTHWMGQLSPADKLAGSLPYLTAAGLISDPPSDRERELAGKVVAAMGDRIKVFSDVLDADYFFQDQIQYDEKALQKRVARDDVPRLLRIFAPRLEALEAWHAAAIEAELHRFCEDQGIANGLMIHALRISTTGSAAGPGVFDCLELVGRDRCLARIEAALRLVERD